MSTQTDPILSQTPVESQTQNEHQDREVWVPLESDPETLQDTLIKYGVEDCVITEVYGEELFDMVPQPIEALIILYPSDSKEIQDWIGNEFKTVQYDDANSTELWHITQRIGNACGTMALIHTFLNLRNQDELREGSPLGSLLELLQCQAVSDKQTTSLQRAELFENNAEAFKGIHQVNAEGGEGAMNTNVHFITIFQKNNHLYLLDGARAGPLDCGECTPDELLQKAWKINCGMYKIWGKETDFATLACTRM